METNSPADALEQRATVRLLHYWRSLPRAASIALPGINAFNPQRNPVGWEKCFLVTLGQSADELPIVEHLGTELSAMMEYEAARPATEVVLLPPLLQSLIGGVAEALRTLGPIQHQGSQVLDSGTQLQYRSILLPFVDFQQQPRYGLGAVTMRTR